MTPRLLMILILGGGAFLLLVLFALFWPESGDGEIKKRLARVSGEVKQNAKAEPKHNLRRSTLDSDIPLLDKLIKAFFPNPQKLRARLERTGHTITLGTYLLVNALLIMVAFVVLSKIMGKTLLVSVTLAIAIGLYVPHMVVGFIGNRRVTKFLAVFPEAIDTICRGLRSGLPITESIASVGQEMPDPIGIEFRRISDGVRLGRPLEDSMWEVARRLNAPEYRFFIIAMAIQKETGGNLAETLGNLADLLRKRRQLRSKVKAMSSEARASAMIIGSLPFVMFTLLMFVNPDYVMTLFREPKGISLVTFAGFMISLGIFVMKKMISFEL